jgi:hypothetical protein
MICSSVNLDRFIRPSLPSGRTLRIFGGASGGQVSIRAAFARRIRFHAEAGEARERRNSATALRLLAISAFGTKGPSGSFRASIGSRRERP